MKVGRLAMKTSSGKILHFKSAKKMKNWEEVARAVRHGFIPTGKKKRKRRR